MFSKKRQQRAPALVRLRVHTPPAAAYLKVATKLQVGQPTTKLLSGFVLPSHTSSMQWDIHISHTRTWAFTLKWVGDLQETTKPNYSNHSFPPKKLIRNTLLDLEFKVCQGAFRLMSLTFKTKFRGGRGLLSEVACFSRYAWSPTAGDSVTAHAGPTTSCTTRCLYIYGWTLLFQNVRCNTKTCS